MGQKPEEIERQNQLNQFSMQSTPEPNPGQATNPAENPVITQKYSLSGSADMDFSNNLIIAESSNANPNEEYKRLNCLGENENSSIYRVKHNITDEIRVMKVIKKSNSVKDENGEFEDKEIKNEIDVLKTLDHPNILKIFEFYSDKNSYSLITEFCSGGDLFQEIVDKGPFREKYCAFVIYQILLGINHCHNMNIIHRDLKPENILIVDKDKNEFPRIKICDFGTSKILEKGKQDKKLVGSPYYMAPEVFKNNVTEKCDIWSCGVILYLLLSARPPFAGEDDDEIIESVQSARIDYSSPPFNKLSANCLDLLKKLLNKDPEQRISAQEALNHKWFHVNSSQELFNSIKDQKTIKKLIHNLKSYKRDSIIQDVALAYLVHNFPQMKEVINANKLFNLIDTNGDGKINKDDLRQGLKSKADSKALEKNIDQIYRNIDMDNNGYITYEEFVRAAVSKEKFITKNILKFAFRYFDKNDSGEASREELEQVFKQGFKDKDKMKKALDKIIDEVDTNRDGKIQFEEFVAIMKKMLK